MGESEEVSRLLASERELLGQEQVVFRVDTDMIETVYVEEREAQIIVHDRCETWFYIVSHPDSYKAWDHHGVREICARRSVTIVSEEEETLVRLCLERTVESGESLAGVVTAVADAVDAVFDAHSLAGGWRND